MLIRLRHKLETYQRLLVYLDLLILLVEFRLILQLLAAISSDISSVATGWTNIVDYTSNLVTVSDNIASVNTVATNIADVISVANDLKRGCF